MDKSHAVVSASEGPTPKQMKEFWLQVESGRMNKDRLQIVLRGRAEEAHLAQPQASPFFADEEMETGYGYPPRYAVKSIPEQLLKLTARFPNLDPEPALNLYRQMPDLSSFVPETWMGREVRRWVNWYAIPRRERVATTENEAVGKVLYLISRLDKRQLFPDDCKDNIDPKHLRLSERTAVALQMLGEKQNGDYLLIPAQFGMTHRGRSVRRVRMVYAGNEFGLGSFITGCMLLSHPERIGLEQLNIDCPGDEYSLNGDSVFSQALTFFYDSGLLKFFFNWVNSAGLYNSSASGFLPVLT